MRVQRTGSEAEECGYGTVGCRAVKTRVLAREGWAASVVQGVAGGGGGGRGVRKGMYVTSPDRLVSAGQPSTFAARRNVDDRGYEGRAKV
jgi:hypothetical protein